MHAPLAEYPFPSSLQRRATQFTESVISVIQNLPDRPILQCSFATRHERHIAPEYAVGNPRAWIDSTLDSLALQRPDQMLFVHPVATPVDYCGGCNARAPSSKDREACSLASTNDSFSLEGKLGDDCCREDHDDSNGDHDAHRVLHTPEHLMASTGLPAGDYVVQYYGVVAQSHFNTSNDGCYLIKTVQVKDRLHCNCIHYSLIRICYGMPLMQQAQQFWLNSVLAAAA